jgi:2-hydroxycyclohexanecarboxyl-CoA dehydrogenase
VRGLQGKRVIVTGGASGIGRACVQRLIAEGCTVAIFDRDQAGAEATVALAKAGVGQARSYAVDIADYSAVAGALAGFEREFGPTEGLAHVAGWDRPQLFLDTNQDFWNQVIRINLYGTLVMHHVVARGMAEHGKGRVVNIASDAGRVGSSGEAVYAACKGGVIAFTKTLARELAERGVTLNTVCPGPTETPLFASFKHASPFGTKLADGLKRAIPLRRLGQPEDYAGMIAFLLSDDAGYITGQTISVSGGLTMQ